MYDAFFRFGAALRRRGIRVERVTLPSNRRVEKWRRTAHRLIFARVADELRFDPETKTVDASRVQLPNRLLALEAFEPAAHALATARALPANVLRGPRMDTILDKLLMTEFAASLKIPVPKTWTH